MAQTLGRRNNGLQVMEIPSPAGWRPCHRQTLRLQALLIQPSPAAPQK